MSIALAVPARHRPPGSLPAMESGTAWTICSSEPGGDGLVPLDKWFGTWHDGSKESEALMEARFEGKRARMNAGKNKRVA
jgi:hypothetical protein